MKYQEAQVLAKYLICTNDKCGGYNEKMECNCNWKMNRIEVIACKDRILDINLINKIKE